MTETDHLQRKFHDIIVYDVQLSHPELYENAPPYFHSSPLRLLAHDLGVLVRNARDIINIFRPFPRFGDQQKDVTYTGILGQVAFIAVSLVVTGVMFASFMTGFPMPVVAVGLWVVTLWAMARLQGKVRHASKGEHGERFKDEAWLFVNGIATSASGLQLILDYLHAKFGRKVIGIHNRTFGIWWDLVECMLQRDFLWPTLDIREGYQTIVENVKDKDVKKVVLLAHSQGGIIMSTWVDQLLADFAAEQLAKVEIYTFAAAANHFSVLYTLVNAAKKSKKAEKADANGTPEGAAVEGNEQGDRRFVFGAVEHFANTKDYVAQIGVLAFAPLPPPSTQPNVFDHNIAAEGRFAGRIFKRVGATGHMLLSHYFRNGSSILDHPTVQAHSQLAKYLLACPAESDSPVVRLAKEDTVQTVTPEASVPIAAPDAPVA